MSVIQQEYYNKLMELMFQPSGKIKVSSTFHGQMEQINSLLGNDRT